MVAGWGWQGRGKMEEDTGKPGEKGNRKRRAGKGEAKRGASGTDETEMR